MALEMRWWQALLALVAPWAYAPAEEMPVDHAADAWWKLGTGPVGLGGFADVSALRRYGDRLVICGTFDGIGPTVATAIAFFDGTRWAGLPGSPRQVFDACPHPAGGWLIVGPFHDVGGVAAHGAARWDGSAWKDEGFESTFSGDQAWSLPTQTILHGGCISTKNGISTITSGFFRWAAGAWTPWPVELAGGNPARCHFIERRDGSLVLAGSFTSINGVASKNIAVFSGDAWRPIGGGLPWYYALGLIEDADSGLVTWGQSESTGPSALRWDGTVWARPAWLPEGWRIIAGSTIRSDEPSAAGAVQRNPPVAAAIFAICQQSDAESFPVRLLRVAAGGVITRLDGLTAGEVWLTSSPNGRVLVAGRGVGIPGAPNCGAAWWDSTGLHEALPTLGSDGPVECVVVSHDGSLLIGGRFSRCAGVATGCLVRTTPDTAMGIVDGFGSGLSRKPPKNSDEDGVDPAEVTALAEAPDGSVVVSGVFDVAGAVPARWAARWTGALWTPMGDLGGAARTLVALDAVRVVAGGTFNLGGVKRHLLCWDGHTWSPLGGDPDDDVCDIKVDADGSLIIVGFFRHIGDEPFAHIARWDGVRWRTLGSGLNDLASALTRHPAGGWVACGRFTRAGERPARHVAHWDGTTWTPMGDGVKGCPVTLTTWEDCVIAGDMVPLSDNSDSAIAIWREGRWQALGRAVPWVSALCVDRSGILHVGGNFGSAGGTAAGNWARFDLQGFLKRR
jgi:hypothetical protein